MQAAWNGVLVGLATGALVTCVDFFGALRGNIVGNWGAFALSLVSFTLSLLGVLGAVLGLWLFGVEVAATRAARPLPQWRKWLFASIAGLPLLAGAWWVPLSWLTENWPTLTEQDKKLVAGLYLVLLVVVVGLSRLAWWSRDVYRSRPTRLPRAHWPLCGLALGMAGACYWADGRSMKSCFACH
jgi:hypothetical protein